MYSSRTAVHEGNAENSFTPGRAFGLGCDGQKKCELHHRTCARLYRRFPRGARDFDRLYIFSYDGPLKLLSPDKKYEPSWVGFRGVFLTQSGDVYGFEEARDPPFVHYITSKRKMRIIRNISRNKLVPPNILFTRNPTPPRKKIDPLHSERINTILIGLRWPRGGILRKYFAGEIYFLMPYDTRIYRKGHTPNIEREKDFRVSGISVQRIEQSSIRFVNYLPTPFCCKVMGFQTCVIGGVHR